MKRSEFPNPDAPATPSVRAMRNGEDATVTEMKPRIAAEHRLPTDEIRHPDNQLTVGFNLLPGL